MDNKINILSLIKKIYITVFILMVMFLIYWVPTSIEIHNAIYTHEEPIEQPDLVVLLREIMTNVSVYVLTGVITAALLPGVYIGILLYHTIINRIKECQITNKG